MNTDAIARLLQNSGFHILGTDGVFLYLEDPSCILRSFETFIEYAWVVIICITGLLLFGWAISLIRGAKNDIFINMRNLIIILGTLGAVVPIVNMIWGDDLFARGCRTIKVSITELNEILDARNLELSKYEEFRLYENLDIYDSGAIPYSDAPLAATDVPPDLQTVSVTGNNNAFQPTTSTSPDNMNNDNLSVLSVRPGRPGRPAQATQRPTKASARSNDVLYTNADGTQYRHTGGTRAWRNNNPGNIRYSEFSRRNGAIGQAGGFAVFPDEETGMRAISALLRSDSYNRLTVAGAISRYAPPVENNTSAYHRRIQELTGLSINRTVGDLSDEELARMANAIRVIEGWRVGRVVNE